MLNQFPSFRWKLSERGELNSFERTDGDNDSKNSCLENSKSVSLNKNYKGERK